LRMMDAYDVYDDAAPVVPDVLDVDEGADAADPTAPYYAPATGGDDVGGSMDPTVLRFLQAFQRAVREQNTAEIQTMYETTWGAMTEQFFARSAWPSGNAVAAAIPDDGPSCPPPTPARLCCARAIDASHSVCVSVCLCVHYMHVCVSVRMGANVGGCMGQTPSFWSCTGSFTFGTCTGSCSRPSSSVLSRLKTIATCSTTFSVCDLASCPSVCVCVCVCLSVSLSLSVYVCVCWREDMPRVAPCDVVRARAHTVCLSVYVCVGGRTCRAWPHATLYVHTHTHMLSAMLVVGCG
jgi:hypothetical protein